MDKLILKIELRQWLLILSGLALAIFLFSKSPIAQSNHYHNFADGRFLWIPNYQNVLSNLIFIFAGYFAAVYIQFESLLGRERLFLITFVVGVFFTGFGSMYYHLIPNSETLFWDRLPMTVGFASFTFWLLSKSALKKISGSSLEIILFWMYLFLAIGTTIYWSWTESVNQGDLRPYYFVQIYSILAALIVVLTYRNNSYPRRGCVWLFACYVLAKVTEAFDSKIYSASFEIVSGHALKHLIAGVGCVLFLHYLNRWMKSTLATRT